MNTSGTIVMVYFPSSSTYHTPTRLGIQIYLELKMNISTHSLHKECFNNSQNITTSSLWSSWFAMTVRNQRPRPRWVQGRSLRKPSISGALVSFLCKWEGKKITRSGGKRKRKWRFPNEKRSSEMTPQQPFPHLIPRSILSSSRRGAGLHSATSTLPCGEKDWFLLYRLVSSFSTYMAQLFVSLLGRAVLRTSFIPRFLVCPPVAPLILPLNFPYLWYLSASPIQYASTFSNRISLWSGRSPFYEAEIY